MQIPECRREKARVKESRDPVVEGGCRRSQRLDVRCQKSEVRSAGTESGKRLAGCDCGLEDFARGPGLARVGGEEERALDGEDGVDAVCHAESVSSLFQKGRMSSEEEGRKKAEFRRQNAEDRSEMFDVRCKKSECRSAVLATAKLATGSWSLPLRRH